jgi:formamidopyrimidine-DNA glycosylase
MPELPEVEIASRQLRAWLDGHRIVAARAARSRVIRGQAPQRFASLAGRRLSRIQRLGKWMLLEFDGGEGLISHLGMTGKWIRRSQEEPGPSHVRASIALDDGHVLDYRDPRLFGRLIRGRTEQLRELPALRALGPDPLEGIDVDRLYSVLRGTKRSMKEALMDQRTLAGLGNIHVSESLFRARIDPQRPGLSITREEVERLSDCIVDSLRSTLSEEDGPEPITYVEEGGENVFLVYDREGQPCPNCRTAIRRIVQGGRSTFYCPSCQPPWRKRALRRTGPSRTVARADVADEQPRRTAPVRRLHAVGSGRSPPRSR